MSAYRTLNRTSLWKVESSAGVDPTPTVGSNAVLLEAPKLNPTLQTAETNESTATLDDRGPIPTGGFAMFEGTAYLHGSGTPETPPEYAALLKACGMAETILGAAVTGTAQAGAGGTITLASGASSTNGYYVGMPITTTGGTGSGQTRIITGYVGSTKVATVDAAWDTNPDNTTTYSIPKLVKYAPSSSSLASVTGYVYSHRSDGGNSRLHKLLGGVGTFTLGLSVRQPPTLRFQITGALQAPTDVSAPSAPTLQSTRPYPWIGAVTNLGGASCKVAEFSVDAGNTVQLVDDPNGTYGYALAGITRRRTGGRFVAPSELLSVRDVFTAWANSSQSKFATRWGSTAGARFAVTMPAVQYTQPGEIDRDGFGYDDLPFRALGDDLGLIICQY